jgi:hypothetical protein
VRSSNFGTPSKPHEAQIDNPALPGPPWWSPEQIGFSARFIAEFAETSGIMDPCSFLRSSLDLRHVGPNRDHVGLHARGLGMRDQR